MPTFIASPNFVPSAASMDFHGVAFAALYEMHGGSAPNNSFKPTPLRGAA